jgi:MoxR-like ATPase
MNQDNGMGKIIGIKYIEEKDEEIDLLRKMVRAYKFDAEIYRRILFDNEINPSPEEMMKVMNQIQEEERREREESDGY